MLNVGFEKDRLFTRDAPWAEEFQECNGVAAPDKEISLQNYAAAFVVSDALTLIGVGVMLGAVINGFHTPFPHLVMWQIWAISFALCAHFMLAQFLNLYRTKTIFAREYVFPRVTLSFLLSFMAMLLIAVGAKAAENYSRLWFFSWLLLSIGVVLINRLIVLEYVCRKLERGGYVFKALSIGLHCDPVAAQKIRDRTNKEVRVVGGVRLQAIEELALLSERIASDEIDRVYVATPWEEIPLVLKNLNLLRHLSTRVFVLPGSGGESMELEGLSFLGRQPLFCAVREPIHGWQLWLKRMEDIVVASIALTLLSPLFAVVAIAIRLESRGPIFFKQMRAGFNGKVFEIWKFRSMYVEATDHHARVQTSKGDPRVTRVGRFIRRTSIDELPQLFNVLRGSMSVVGPRPHALETRAEDRNLEELVDYYAARHRVRPGMTGWAQIHGLRGELDSLEKLQKRVDYDIEYIDRWTIWLDLQIIFRTAMLMFRDGNAY